MLRAGSSKYSTWRFDSSLSLSAASFPMNSIQSATFQDPNKAVEGQLKLFRALGEGAMFQNSAIKGKPEIKENDQTHKGLKLHFVKITWDLDKLADQIPGGAGDEMKKAMKKLMGDGIQTWFGTDGKRLVTATGKDWPEARAKIDALLDGKSPVGKLEAFSSTRKHLPADATMLMLIDAGPFAMVMGDYLLGIFKAMPIVPFNLPESMKPVQTVPAFFGTSIVMQPEYGSFDFFLPVTAVHEVRKVLMPLFTGE